MVAKYTELVIESFQFVVILVLLIFHVTRMHHIEKTKDNVDSSLSLSLCKTVRITHIVYLILIVYLLKGAVNIIKAIIHSTITDFNLNDNLCVVFEDIVITLGIMARFGIHIFVAMRSRLSCTSQKPSIWFKIGLLLILTDLPLIFMPLITPMVNAKELNGNCIVLSYHALLLIWILFSDFIIGIYSLIVFVIPIKALIKWEKRPTNSGQHSIQFSSNALPPLSPTMANNKSTTSESEIIATDHQQFGVTKYQTLQELVKKIVLYSSIMLISSMFAVIIAAVLSTIHFDNGIVLLLLPPIDNILNSWCIILQFADINIHSIQSPFWRSIISFFQCNSCKKECCCHCCDNSQDIKNMVVDHIKNTASKSKQVENGVAADHDINITIDGKVNPMVDDNMPPSNTLSIVPQNSFYESQSI